MHDNLVTIKECSRRLGIPYPTIHGYVVKHNIPTERNGHYCFVDPEAVRAVLPARKQRTRKAQAR